MKRIHPTLLKSLTISLFGLASALGLTSCNGSGEAGGTADATQALGKDIVTGTAVALPSGPVDPNQITLGMKYVVYTDPGTHQPLISQEQANTVLAGINDLFKQCDVQFRMEKYVPVDAQAMGLNFRPTSMGELETIRGKFDEASEIVVITTGSWDHSGGLGADGANAWTSMPGTNPSGAVIEEGVATTANLVAHEIGHYLNLDHLSDQSNMMNPVIYGNSNTIAQWQCDTVRQAARSVRSAAIR